MPLHNKTSDIRRLDKFSDAKLAEHMKDHSHTSQRITTQRAGEHENITFEQVITIVYRHWVLKTMVASCCGYLFEGGAGKNIVVPKICNKSLARLCFAMSIIAISLTVYVLYSALLWNKKRSTARVFKDHMHCKTAAATPESTMTKNSVLALVISHHCGKHLLRGSSKM